jgi:hypothetical protein
MSEEANDPTRSGAPAPAPGPGTLRLTQGEVEALCLKAARGAGMSWGLAEEAGFAAGWLARIGLNGPGLLLRLLDRMGGATAPDQRPAQTGAQWAAAADRPLCPIALGAALSDRIGLPDGADRAPQTTGPVAAPALILSPLASAAARTGQGFRAEWGGCRVAVGPRGLTVEAGAQGLADAEAEALRVVAIAAPSLPPPPPLAPCTHDTIRRLDAFAMRTTVPASATSRAGAGAGDTDND